MSKAARVRELLEQGLPNSEIASRVGCRDTYVRTVKQRLQGPAPADVNYWRKLGADGAHAYNQMLACKKYRMKDGRAAWARYCRENYHRRKAEATP